ncbi:coiled-coil domain-containing protein 177 [Hemicordylus capensis]|uniref:coiled-coil domain-containing protein 177 n=1 Tax=Hemicordylus capensis TaxID=884348 RepID=UPI0023026391|nr:coiled-coil domain-containing protein 177 [Hemicordylus capensis]XP_053142046.1 coiled-coil domain-containing protein 177 [Hemicordylus capensis]
MVDPVADTSEENCTDSGDAEAGGEEAPAAAAAAATPATTAAAASPAAGAAAQPPAAPPVEESGKLREESPMLHLDLYNFDCPEAEGSRYVLTSPRSLEACARCAVKPVELLPRLLSELVKEAPGRSMRVAAGLYEVYEMDRQRKLQQCREERERIIREEKRRLFTPLLIGSLPSSPASRISFKSTVVNGSCTPAGQPNAGCPPPHSGTRTKKSYSLDSLQKRREGLSTKTSSDSGASSSFSGDSFRDKWPKELPSTRTVATMVGRSFSLGDLCHSPQTTKKVERIVKEVKKKKGLKVVSERDRKIAALMIAKHQEESILNEQRYSAHLQWDIQRRQAEQRREQEEKQKQRALLQCQRMWETKQEKRRCKLTQEQQEAALLRQKQKLEGEEKWQELMEKKEKIRREKLEKAALEDKHKKRHQEHNLKAQEEGKKEALEREVQLLQEKMSLAAQKKLRKEQLLLREKKLLNEAEKRKHEATLKDLARQGAEEKALLKASVEGSLNKAQENYEQLIEKRNQDLREKARREEMQFQRVRVAAGRRERDQKEHLEAMAKATERKLQHAAQVAEEVVQQKARKVVQSRLEKEKVQKVNKRKVEQCEDTRRREILLSIEKKLERSEQICKEKKNVLENARSVARASFHVREKVREEMNLRTFDKMAMEAELQASLAKK